MLSDIIKQIKLAVTHYIPDVRGSVMVAFALMIPVVIGSAGLALDIAEAYVVRQRLGQALDASTLAAAAMETEEASIESRVQDFFEANYPEDKIGTTYDLDVNVDGDDVIVTAKADFNTSFMHLFGYDKITVSSGTTVHREVQGLEVVLVLDNTGSMGGTNIQSLRTASRNFVEILFERVNNPESIKIGLVPYSSSVRIGTYGFGENPDGSIYGDGSTFVVDGDGDPIDPDRYTTNYNARDYYTANWYGCVVERNEDGWDKYDDENDPYPLDVNDHEGPWPIYEYGRYDTDCSYSSYSGYSCTTEWDTSSYPNRYCPRASILPMTSDEQALYDVIDDMQAEGSTIGSFGMSWGQRMISPDYPFQEGAAWDDPEWRKAVIMMTDGQNSMGGGVTGYWRTDNHDIDNNDLDNRFAEVCELLKDNDVLVYTVTFSSGINESTKDYYRNCATSPAQYYDAPDQDDLVEVFENISRQLANLHISN